MPEPSPQPPKVVWVHDRGHATHPFIVLCLRTLTQAGCKTTIIDYDPKRAPDRGKAKRSSDAGRKDLIDQKPEQRLRYRLWHRVRPHIVSFYINVVMLPFFFRAFVRLLTLDVDVIVASRPPAALVAFPVARLRGKRFVYYPFELYGCQFSPYSRTVALLERLMLRSGVDALITQNEQRAEVYRQRGNRNPPVIVHNYKPFQNVPPSNALRQKLNIPPEMRIVLYEGVLSDGRWLDRVAAASLLLPPQSVLVMMGPQQNWWKKHAPRFLSEPIRQGRLIVTEEVAHESLLSYVADADVGIVIYDDSALNNYLCEPGKLSDYVLGGVPVVAPRFPTIAPIVERLGIGACFENGSPQAIAAAISQVLSRPREFWRPGLDAARKKLIWSTQAPAFIAAVTGDSNLAGNADVARPATSAAADHEVPVR
jgi:glycosyltransferase involved in cell wall biosynthesis